MGKGLLGSRPHGDPAAPRTPDPDSQTPRWRWGDWAVAQGALGGVAPSPLVHGRSQGHSYVHTCTHTHTCSHGCTRVSIKKHWEKVLCTNFKNFRTKTHLGFSVFPRIIQSTLVHRHCPTHLTPRSQQDGRLWGTLAARALPRPRARRGAPAAAQHGDTRGPSEGQEGSPQSLGSCGFLKGALGSRRPGRPHQTDC